MQTFRTPHGFTLMEMMIGISLSTILMTGIIQLLSGSVAAYRLQLSLSHMEESGRFARDLLMTHIGQAGYQAEPWHVLSPLPAITSDATEGGIFPGDQIGLQRWSDRNCYGSENPVKDEKGKAKFHLLQTRFSVNTAGNLALTCRYGPTTTRLTTQIRNLGVIENVESMQVLYAEDRSGDGITDRWVQAQAWENESAVLAVKVALLLSSRQPFNGVTSTPITLLDRAVTLPADQHLRKVVTVIAAVQGRL